MPIVMDGGATYAPSNRRTPEERISSIEDWSGQTLPTRLVLALSQSQLEDPQLQRASVLLAQRFDLPPSWFFRPFEEFNFGRHRWGSPVRLFRDPGNPEEPLSWAAAKRLVRPFEAQIIAGMLSRQVERHEPELVLKVIKAMAPMSGEHVAFAPVLAAALQIASAPEVDVVLPRFAQNMRVVSSSPSIAPLMQIAIAHEAAKRGLVFEDLGDVAKLVVPGAKEAIELAQTPVGERPVAQDIEVAMLTLGPEAEAALETSAALAGVKPETIGVSERALQLETIQAGFGEQILAAFKTPGDLLAQLQDTQDNYIEAAKELNDTVRIPFTDSFVGHIAGKALDLVNRPFGAALRTVFGAAEFLVSPITEQVQQPGHLVGTRSIAEIWGDTYRDTLDIWHGRTTEFAELEKLGIPAWATVTIELFTAFKLPALDPLIAGGRLITRQRELKTIFGLAERGRAGEWPERVQAFIRDPVGRIGDLRDVSITQYLLREADRTRDAAIFYNRAIDNFRRYFGAEGIHPMVAERVWRFAQASRKSRLPQALRERAVDEVLLSAFGVTPRSGSLASEIETVFRATRSRVAEQLPLGLTTDTVYTVQPAARLERDAETALGVLNDTALTLASHGFLMTEIPHLAGPLTRVQHALRTSGLAETSVGRTVRTVFQQNPKWIGARFTIAIEDPAEAVRDFDRALIRAEVFDVNEMATARLELEAAIRPDNPLRELNFIDVVSRYDKLQVERIASKYGIPDDLVTKIVDGLDAKLGRARKGEVFGVEARVSPGGVPEAAEFREPFLITQRPNQWQMLDPLLLRRGIAETVGTARKWRAGMLRALGASNVPAAKAVKIPMRRFLDDALDLVVRDLFLSWFKPLIVIRPAYVLRVVGLEEQSRFLATAGAVRRLESGKTGSRITSAVDDVLGKERALEVPWQTPEGIETRVLHFPRPGRLPNEPLANNLTNRIALASEEGPMRRLLEATFANKWGVVERTDPQFYDQWFNALQEQFGRDVLGRRYLDDIARGVSEQDSIDRAMAWLLDRSGEGPRYVQRLLGQSLSEVSQETLRLQVQRGVHYANDLTSGHPQLAAAARDNLLKAEDLRAVPVDEVPAFVHGPLVSESVLAKIGPIKRMTDGAKRWILQEPTNRLSRQPYFKSWYDRMLRSLVTTAKESGIPMTDELLAGFRETAREFGIAQVKRIMFDFTREGRIDELTRNVLMFVQPYLEWPVVWTRIVRQNPAFIGYAVRLGRTALASGVVRTDPETGELVVPMSWWAGAAPLLAAVTGGQLRPIGQGGGWELVAPLTSFNLFAQSAFSFPTGGIAGELPIPMPSVNPEALWVFQQLLVHTDMDAAVKARLASWLFAYGPVSPSKPETLLPPHVERTLKALMPGWLESEQNLAATHFLQLQEAMGLEPDAELARTQARLFTGVRAFFGLIFPAAPRINFPTEELEQQYRQTIDTLGFEAGTEHWMKFHPELRLITIPRTMWAEDNPSPISMPTTQLAAQLLQTKGAREFAQAHPLWAWAIIPSELREGKFDIGTFFSQIASGQRVALSPEDYLARADVRKGWDAFFAEQELWLAWQEVHPDLGIGDPSYEQAANEHQEAIDELRALNPSWASEAGRIDLYGTDPRVLAEARRLSTDKLFTQTDAGAGLVDYFKLRDEILDELASRNLTSVRTITAERLGITERYDSGVEKIIEAHPDFGTAYRLFFFSDLQRVKTAGDRALDAVPPDVYDEQITPWWEQFEKLRDQPNRAGSEGERNMAYENIRVFVEQAYERFDAKTNPLILRWKTWDPNERSDYIVSLIGRGYTFYSRFDRQTLLGDRSTPKTESLWSTYNLVRIQIAEAEATDPNFTASDAYKRLDAWVLGEAAANKTFAEQVAHANSWGYAFSKILPELFSSTRQSGPYWQAFLDAVGEVESMVYAYKLHGDAEFDPKRKVAYTVLRQALTGYIDVLRQESLAFRRQWDWLEEATGPDPLLSYFQPDVWFPVGGYPK